MLWWHSLLMLFGVLTLLLLVGLPAGFAFLAINLVGAVVYLGGEAGLMQVVRNSVASVTNFFAHADSVFHPDGRGAVPHRPGLEGH